MVYGTQITLVTGANLNQQTSLGGLILQQPDFQWDVMTSESNMREKTSTKFRVALIDIVMFECELPLMWMANIIQKARIILF